MISNKKKWVLKIEQYITGEWVTLLESTTDLYFEADMKNDVKELKDLFYKSEKVALDDYGEKIGIIATTSNGPVKISYKEFK